MPEEATLIYAVPGSGLPELLSRFTASLPKNPLTHWLILPTDTLVRQVRDLLGNVNHPVVFNQICTREELCLVLLSEYKDGNRFITDTDARVLLSRVIGEYSKELSLFSDDHTPSGRMLLDLQRLFSYITRNELSYPGCLGNLASRKSDQIGTIYAAYNRRLNRLCYRTTDTLIAWAAGSINGRSLQDISRRFTHLYWLGEYDPAPLERRLIQAFSDKIAHMVYVSPHGEDQGIFGEDASFVYPGRRYTSEKIPLSPREKATTLLFSDRFAEKEAGILRESVSLATWKDPVSELSAIAKEIQRLRKQQIPLSDIAVVFPDPDPALGYLADVFDDYHIPYHCSTAPYLSTSPLVSYFMLVGECVEKGFRYEELIRLIRSPYLNYTWAPDLVQEDDALYGETGDHTGGTTDTTKHHLDYESLDLICRSYGILGGYIDWETRFEQISGYIASEKEPGKFEEGKNDGSSLYIQKRPLPGKTIIQTIQGTLSLIRLLRTLLVRGRVSDHCRAFRDVLQQIGSPVPGGTGKVSGEGIELLEDEQIALLEFNQVLTDLLQQPGDEDELLSFPEFLSRMRLLLMDRRIRTKDHDGVLIAGIGDIGHLPVPYLFFASLNEGLIPRHTYRLPFINGSEAAKIGDDLHVHLKKERYRFISALLTGRKQVYLSSFEHRDDRTVLSSSFLEPFKQVGSFPSWGEETGTPQPDGCPDSECAYYSGNMIALSRWDEALAFLSDSDRVSDIVTRIGIEHNFRFRLNRSVYDGIIGDGTAVCEEMEERFGYSYPWSATLIETYARCPYRFYLEHILHIKPLPMLGSDLSPDAKGRLIHSVLSRFKHTIQKRDGFPIRQDAYHDAVSAILEIAEEELDTVSYDTPVWLAKRRQLLGGERYGAGMFEKYVASEIKRLAPDEEGDEPKHFIPKHFEFSFGAVPEKNDDPASVSRPVDLAAIALRRVKENRDIISSAEDIPHQLLLCGKIDRIDLTNDGDFGVVDYKTGIKIPSTTEIASGKALQLPLYLLAFAEITGNNPVYGSYCHLYRSVTHAISLYNPAYQGTLPRGKMPRSEPKWENVLDNALLETCNHVWHIHQGIFPIHADRGCSPDWFCPYKTICRFQPDRGSHLDEWIWYPERKGDVTGKPISGGEA